MNEKMQELLNDEAFMKAFVTVENPQELEALLASKEIVLDGITAEQALALIKKQSDEELDEEALEDVSGGILVSTAILATASLAFGAANISFYASYAYHKYFKK